MKSNMKSSQEVRMNRSGSVAKPAYAPSEICSVTPPAELTAPSLASGGDTLQDLISRMREAKRNRTRFHLTEGDCNRMCKNATERSIASGQVIIEEGAPITAVYRIKKGSVSLVKSNVKLYDLSVVYLLSQHL